MVATRVVLMMGLMAAVLVSVALAFSPARLEQVDESNTDDDSLEESMQKLEANLALRKSLVEVLREFLGEGHDTNSVDSKRYERVKYAGWRPTEMLYTKGKWAA
ncbi:Hypp8657 [Branchiostoma lanceolatum]|uniref:Hypp8657 protein n=1 Tax=Branchiostoma lanceolatum TaxID=7740 RepID=A0A8K0EIJ3_BRALA|nr:Hypp8657 [Branchiostoma lanceolatum]